ncbi:Cyclic di-GMP phosphodiesterase response regulator RpfG [Polystyrenella longa]|uniref:Cyclic di-GMP phosphodiesterase response regulator RpfG n=1 Tax=Polystyrenella longa TaxID=2528007 RepID=A0A518CNP4_9PLAN|nr:HD-GYP domain-containing protein [Polystyrenella longa]QDU80828.1 Cyclic di-GMP phosphodiesterase response regulator RpfG [Polystyrenella longa]
MISQSVSDNTIRQQKLSGHTGSLQQAIIEQCGQRLKELKSCTGIPFFAWDIRHGKSISRAGSSSRALIPECLLSELKETQEARKVQLNIDIWAILVPLVVDGFFAGVAVGYVCAHESTRPADLVIAAAIQNWPENEFNEWLEQIPACSESMLDAMVKMLNEHSLFEQMETDLNQSILQLDQQLEHTYEEISLLHRLTSNLHISRSPADLGGLCLDGVSGLVPAAAHLIWFNDKVSDESFIVHGELPFDEFGLARLVAQFETHNWSQPLVKNYFQETSLGKEFPGLDNFILVPITEASHRSGWILSCNMQHDEEFGTIEANLLKSIATILGTHLRNIQLYEEIQKLILSFVQSLVSTLDAKDPYTRGHSERVALIARRIAEELGWSNDELENIYLSGLLHDLGKIGVDDRVLRKEGPLDKEEFAQIQQHPMIGFSILKRLKNLQQVLPGIRSHHESFDGRGYPDGLKGDDIPIMARILAVADSYDAMGSDRPYRSGMPVDKIESILSSGAGKQWDSKVVETYFNVREDILRICREYSPEGGILNANVNSDDAYV